MKKATLKHVGFSSLGVFLGVVITPVAIWVSFKHGDGFAILETPYFPLLFPFSKLLSQASGDFANRLLFTFLFCQFPVYGLLLGDAAAIGRKRFAWTSLLIGVFHGLAVSICCAQ
ncbi:MAG TPA: hypothetical protein VG711_12390 [Phycisphaerales bacterium]|nr:hypothetical protein [Phycisphaerales bacterium]